MIKTFEEELKEYRELADKCKEIKIPFAFGMFNLEAIKEGKILDQRKQVSHSWVRNMYNLILHQITHIAISTGGIYGAGGLYLRNTSGTDAYFDNTKVIFNHNSLGLAGETLKGIIVGTSTQAESFDHYNLIAPINNGTGVGQMSYTADDSPEFIYESVTKKWTITHRRYINNNSGGSITVNEVGLASLISYGTRGSGSFSTSPVGYCLLCRDLVSPGITVPNAGQLKAEYIFELTFPA